MSKNNGNVGFWQMDMCQNVSIGNFNNVTDVEKYGVIPGQKGDHPQEIINPDARPIVYREFNEEDYQYYFLGKDYFYGIFKDGTEVISAVDSQGRLLDVYDCAGKLKLATRRGEARFLMTDIASFEEIEVDGYKGVKIWYNSETTCRFVDKAVVTYLFKETGIAVEMHTVLKDLEAGIHKGGCFVVRNALNDASVTKKRIAYNWNYPEDNDFTHLVADAVAISGEYDGIAVYTFCRDTDPDKRFNLEIYNCEKLPFIVGLDVTDIDRTYYMDIVFTKATGKESYEALFKGRHMNFAAGIAAVEDNESTTFFMGKDVLLNINVTNISNSDIEFGVRYNVINHYNEIVSSGTFYHNKLAAGQQANRNLDLKLDNYGMHYLNLYVTDGVSEYRECYHFAMLEEFDFKYRENSQFGICAPHTDNAGESDVTAKLLKKLGISSTRLGKSDDNHYFHERLKENGIETLAGIYGNKGMPVEEYFAAVKQRTDKWMNKVKCFLIANEMDKFTKGNYDKSKRLIETNFIPNTIEPIYEYLTTKYPDKDIVWESNCHGSLEWLEAFYESGLWDKSKIIDVHSYSSPSGPDKCFSNQWASMQASLFSNEYAAVRWKRITRRYGDKRLMIGETGYPTPYDDRREIDIRTQADFNTRIALFFLEIKAELIEFYCLYDRISWAEGTGTGKNVQMFFGACYNHDYYGIYMPKPWAAAYANLTRRLDGVESCKFFDEYEEDEWGTLRAFKVNKKDGTELAVLWSNIYMQPNTTAEGRINNVERIPFPAWENHWLETETRTFAAVGDTVEVIDIMGNKKVYTAKDGKVDIEVSGSPIFVYGIKGDADLANEKRDSDIPVVGNAGIC